MGIGGSGMSSLAHCLLDGGCAVSGSDLSPGDVLSDLGRRGARIAVGHDAANVPSKVELLVRSAAIPETNPEVLAAHDRGIPVLKYAEMLGRLAEGRAGVAVAGCHGKTTTTAMISYILERAGLSPSFVCGAPIPQLGRGGKLGKGPAFVSEACEYDRSFLRVRPKVAVITNIEEDHLDYYADLGEIIAAFREFAARAEGLLVAGVDNPNSAEVLKAHKGRAEGFGVSAEADWRAHRLAVKDGRWTFEVLKFGRAFGEYVLGVPGAHNVGNALAAIAAATDLGVGQEIIAVALSEFTGAARRFEFVGERKGVTVIDDYAHHPTEIKATLRAARERFPGRPVWAVFQPHQYARTRLMLREFAQAFGDADIVLLPEIFSARDVEKEKHAVSSQDLARLLSEQGKAALFVPTLDEVVKFLRAKAKPGVVVLTLGAGNVYEAARRFARGS